MLKTFRNNLEKAIYYFYYNFNNFIFIEVFIIDFVKKCIKKIFWDASYDKVETKKIFWESSCNIVET